MSLQDESEGCLTLAILMDIYLRSNLITSSVCVSLLILLNWNRNSKEAAE